MRTGESAIAIVRYRSNGQPFRNRLELEGDRPAKPPRGFDPQNPLIDDLKMKDFVTSHGFTEQQVCGRKFVRDFAVACARMSPQVEFTTKALGQKYLAQQQPLNVAPQRQ